MGYIFTSESVSEGHPDKVCDQISDAILDSYLAQDPNSRVACETLIKNNTVIVAGEITSNGTPNIEEVIRNTVNEIGYSHDDLGFNGNNCEIQNLISKSSKVLVGGGIANTFLKAAGYEVGLSLVEDEMIDISKELLDTNKIILPRNVYVAESTQANSAELVPVDGVSEDKMILDIELSDELKIETSNSYIIWNGPLGIFEIEQFSTGTNQLVKFLESSSSKVVAGGGETIYAISKFSDISKFHYVSTAGGAFLEYLSGHKLPSIEALRLK